MKELIALFFVFAWMFSQQDNQQIVADVEICYNSTDRSFHRSLNYTFACPNLKDCTDIRWIDSLEARKRELTPCEFCFTK